MSRILCIVAILCGAGLAVPARAQSSPEAAASLVVPEPPVGGENSPPASAAPQLVTDTAELRGEGYAVRVPTGSYTATGGEAVGSVPGPIVAFRGPDGRWRGHGYLETTVRLVSFAGTVEDGTARLDYRFENGKRYRATVTVAGGAVRIDEESYLGPRNVWVLDASYGWQPAAGFVTNLPGTRHAFVYLPCYYDKPEATVNPSADLKAESADPARTPGGVAVVHASDEHRDVLGVWCRDVADWRRGDTMGLQLWQRRQLPGDPSSRHFLGPETKSDSTPNPRTAGMLGRSLYEGHVTIEMNLGVGTRKLSLAVVPKGSDRPTLPEPLMSLIQRDSDVAKEGE